MTRGYPAIELGSSMFMHVPAVSHDSLRRFARASGDHNPIHLDQATARAAGYEDVIVHGMLSMAFVGRVLTTWFPQCDLRAFSVRFVAMTPVGSELRVTGEVEEIVDAGARRLAHIVLRVTRDDGACTLEGTAVAALH